MKLRITLPLAALGLASLAFATVTMVSGGPRHALAVTNCDTNTADLDPAEQQMVELLNGARSAAGLAPLKSSPNLNRAAAWKSEDQVGKPLSHRDSFGRELGRLNQCGYPGGATGENVAAMGGPPATVFAAWMGSPAHRANMLGGPGVPASFKVVGIGRAGSQWTMDFGSFDDSGSPAPPPAPSATPTAGFPTSTPTRRPSSSASPIATASPTATPTATSSNQGIRRPRAIIAMLAVASADE